MKVKYFQDTDTLYIEFKPGPVMETRDLDENTLLELDAGGHICAITVEHARANAPTFRSFPTNRLRPNWPKLRAGRKDFPIRSDP